MNLVNKNKPGPGEEVVESGAFTRAGVGTPLDDAHACLDTDYGKEFYCRLNYEKK